MPTINEDKFADRLDGPIAGHEHDLERLIAETHAELGDNQGNSIILALAEERARKLARLDARAEFDGRRTPTSWPPIPRC